MRISEIAITFGPLSAVGRVIGVLTLEQVGGSQRAAPAGVRPDCNVLDRAPRVRANNSSKAIFGSPFTPYRVGAALPCAPDFHDVSWRIGLPIPAPRAGVHGISSNRC